MAHKLSRKELPQLLSWLSQNLPATFKLHGELERHLRGKFPGLVYFVNRRHDPQAVVGFVEDTKDQQWGSYALYRGQVQGVFAVEDEALAWLLCHSGVIDWNERTTYWGVPEKLWPTMATVANEKRKSFNLIKENLLRARPQDLQPVPVPRGMKLSAMSGQALATANATWNYCHYASDHYIRKMVKNYTSLMLTSSTGQLVGHITEKSDGSMGTLFVLPEFRGRGYANVIVSQMAQKFFEKGKDAYVVIVDNNLPSFNLHLALGFQVVPGAMRGYIVYGPCENDVV